MLAKSASPATSLASERWKVLIAVFVVTVTFSLTMYAIPPVLPLIMQEFRLSHAEAGLMMSLFALPMVFLAIPTGILSDRCGPRATGLGALALTIVGTSIVAATQTFPLLLAGRALAGTGALTLTLISPHLISQWFKGKELGLAMSIFNTGVPLGMITSLVTMGYVGQALGWRIPVLISAAFAVLSVLVFALLTRSPSSRGRAVISSPPRVGVAQAGIPIWLVGAAWMFFSAATVPFSTFGPDYFQSEGYSVTNAGLLSSMLMWGSLFLGPLVGLLLDRGFSKVMMVATGGAGMAASFFLIPLLPLQEVPVLLLLAVSNILVPIAVFSLPSELLDRRMLGFGFGVLSSLVNVGAFVGPVLAGYARDVTGNYFFSFWTMAGLALLLSLTIIPVRLNRNQ